MSEIKIGKCYVWCLSMILTYFTYDCDLGTRLLANRWFNGLKWQFPRNATNIVLSSVHAAPILLLIRGTLTTPLPKHTAALSIFFLVLWHSLRKTVNFFSPRPIHIPTNRKTHRREREEQRWMEHTSFVFSLSLDLPARRVLARSSFCVCASLLSLCRLCVSVFSPVWFVDKTENFWLFLGAIFMHGCLTKMPEWDFRLHGENVVSTRDTLAVDCFVVCDAWLFPDATVSPW